MPLLHNITIITYYYVFETGQLADEAWLQVGLRQGNFGQVIPCNIV